MTRDEIDAYWRGPRGLVHQTPPGSRPEGFDVSGYLWRSFFLDPYIETVLEFGCGTGRLAGMFLHATDCLYTGVDVSDLAIAKARERFADRKDRFSVVEYGKAPDSDFDAGFSYTVFLHVRDEDLGSIVEAVSSAVRHRFVVGEILGRAWRIPGQADPPVFNRERQEYVDVFERFGWSFRELRAVPYRHYAGKAPGGGDEVVSFLVFDRE